MGTTWSIIAKLLEFLTLKIVRCNNHGCCFKPVSFEIKQSSILPEIVHESQILGGILSTYQQSPIESVYTIDLLG